MLGLVSCYTPDEHTIVQGEIGLFCNRLVEHDPQRRGNLFILRYNKLEVYCICEWVGGGRDTFVDVLNLGKSLGSFEHREACELRRRLFNPVTAEESSREIIRNDSNYYHGLQDEDMEETERQERVALGE